MRLVVEEGEQRPGCVLDGDEEYKEEAHEDVDFEGREVGDLRQARRDDELVGHSCQLRA